MIKKLLPEGIEDVSEKVDEVIDAVAFLGEVFKEHNRHSDENDSRIKGLERQVAAHGGMLEALKRHINDHIADDTISYSHYGSAKEYLAPHIAKKGWGFPDSAINSDKGYFRDVAKQLKVFLLKADEAEMLRVFCKDHGVEQLVRLRAVLKKAIDQRCEEIRKG